jgi:hypothetical protein
MKSIPLLLTAVALIAPTAPALTNAPDADASPLAGPRVPEHQTRTLVSRNMTGDFVRVEGRPEAAALRLLDLDPATAERAAAIVGQRTVDLSLMLVDRIDEVREMTDLSEAGDREGARAVLRRIWEQTEPDSPRAPLLRPLGEVLPPSKLVELQGIVDEYWEAWIDWELRDSDERRANARVRTRVAQRLAFGLFEREVREGYDISLKRYRDALDGIYTAVEPTEDQRRAIRGIVIDHIKATRLEATPAQRRDTMTRVYRLLDEPRRERLFEYMTRVVIPDA